MLLAPSLACITYLGVILVDFAVSGACPVGIMSCQRAMRPEGPLQRSNSRKLTFRFQLDLVLALGRIAPILALSGI